MITHHDFFSGSLGKFSHLELPRMFSSPRTNLWIHDYSVSLGSNIRGSFLACSLDARLWLFRLSRRLAVVVCNWDQDTGKLVRSASSNISNNYDVFLARGLNWVLSNNTIFMADEASPYIRHANLFDNSNDNSFFYSFFRSQALSSVELTLIGVQRAVLQQILKSACADRSNNISWGQREDNGNSDGEAFFSKNTHLLYPAEAHVFEQCYSLLPSVGDWIIFENFLIRKPDMPPTASYHGMLNIRPLIPLELHFEDQFETNVYGYTIHMPANIPTFGTGYNFNNRGIQVAYLHHQLWGRGLFHIGKVFIIAAGFDKDGYVQEYYLYISPDFHDICSSTASENWDNVAIANIGDNDNIYGFLSAEPDPISGGMCVAANDYMILDTSGKNWSWISLTDCQEDHNKTNSEGKLFFDYANSSALLLDDKGAKIFLDNLEPTYDFSCSNLRQWLAPADKVEAVSDSGIVASADNSAFFTELQRDFHRALFSPCVLPLSAKSYQVPSESSNEQQDSEKVKLSLSTEANSSNTSLSLLVKHSSTETSGDNYSASEDDTLSEGIQWDDVFRKPVSLNFIGHTSIEADSAICFFDYFGLHKDDCELDFWNEYLSYGTGDFIHKKDIDFYVNAATIDNCFVGPYPFFYTRINYADKDNDPVKYYYDEKIATQEDYWNIFVSKYPEYQDKFDYFINLEFGEMGFDPDLFNDFHRKWAEVINDFQFSYFYHSIEADVIFVHPISLSVQKFTVAVHTNDDIISGRYGQLHAFYSNNIFGFEYRVLDTSPDNPIRDVVTVDDYWTQYAWGDVDSTGVIQKTSVADNIPDSILNFCADYDYQWVLSSIHPPKLTQQKKDSLVAPSVRLACVTCSTKYKDSSVAVFFSSDHNIPFLLEFPSDGIQTPIVSTFPDRTSAFVKKNGQIYSKSQLHMAMVFSNNGKKLDLYSFRSEYDPNIFNFDDDLERCKSS